MSYAAPVQEPIPISKVSGHYLLFDINAVTHLRRTHNICGVLIGGIPQVPQQNLLNGLPVQLSPEEARLLVEKNIAYIVDDLALHKTKFSSFSGGEKRAYLESLRKITRTAEKKAGVEAEKRAKRGAQMKALNQAKQAKSSLSLEKPQVEENGAEDAEATLFGNNDEDGRAASTTPSDSVPPSQASLSYTVTPTTTSISSSTPAVERELPAVPVSYPLFAHLHDLNYFITPGLRFGCDYNVYPGDQLRFHSHFLAVGHAWDQLIPMMDLVSGGRLGTGVKKGYLVGAKDPKSQPDDAAAGVRTFSIEWGGM